jgi:hypothetical protein
MRSTQAAKASYSTPSHTTAGIWNKSIDTLLITAGGIGVGTMGSRND